MANQRDYSEDMCQEAHVHLSVVEQVRERMPDDDTLCDVAEMFKVFGDITRTKILSALFETELCVCDISEIVKMSTSAVSHQLRILKQARLIKSRRDGKTVFYSLADDHVATLLRQGTEHISED